MRKIINIIKNIHKLPRVSKATFLIEDAWNLMAQEKLSDAEALFEEGEHLLTKLDYEHKIMKGVIKFNLSKHEECFNVFNIAWSDVENDSELSSADKLYLQWYMYTFVSIYRKILKINLKNIKPIQSTDVPLYKVSSVWRRRFPQRDHPDWDKYGA